MALSLGQSHIMLGMYVVFNMLVELRGFLQFCAYGSYGVVSSVHQLKLAMETLVYTPESYILKFKRSHAEDGHRAEKLQLKNGKSSMRP